MSSLQAVQRDVLLQQEETQKYKAAYRIIYTMKQGADSIPTRILNNRRN
jgi:hypothetical protein